MGILRSIESSLERVVEGSFGRLFRASVQPVELARKLAKELEEGKVVSVSQTYAPNEYTVYLSRKDRERFVEYEASLRSELASYLAEQARRAGYVLPTRPRVRFETSTALAVGIFGISTAVVQEEASEAYERSLGGVEEQAPAPAVPPPPLAEERAPATVTSLPGMPPPIAPPPAPVLEVVADPEPVLPPAVLPLGPYDAVSGLDDVPPLEPEDAEDGPSEADEPVPAAALGLAPELPSEPEAVDEDPEEAAPGLELAPDLPADEVEVSEPEPPVRPEDEISEPFELVPEPEPDRPAGPAPVVPLPLSPPAEPRLPPPVAPLPANVTPIRAVPPLSPTEVAPMLPRAGQTAREEIALVLDGRRIPIEHPVVVLGRAPGCDVTLDDRNVSRRHAEVRRRGPVVVLVDLESTNGTIVNGRRVREHPLADGDRITLGNSRLTFERRVH